MQSEWMACHFIPPVPSLAPRLCFIMKKNLGAPSANLAPLRLLIKQDSRALLLQGREEEEEEPKKKYNSLKVESLA